MGGSRRIGMRCQTRASTIASICVCLAACDASCKPLQPPHRALTDIYISSSRSSVRQGRNYVRQMEALYPRRLMRFPDHGRWIVKGERPDAAPPPHDMPRFAGEGEDRQPLMHAADDAVVGLRGKHVRHLDRRWCPGGEAGVVRGRPSGANEKRERWRFSVDHPLAAWVGCRTRALLLLCDCGNEKRRDRYRVGVMPRYAMRGRRASGMGGGRRIGMRC